MVVIDLHDPRPMMAPWPPRPPRARNWPALFLGTLASLIGSAALTVALIRTGPTSTPTYTPAQKNEAKLELCSKFELAMSTVRVETNLPHNASLAGISLVDGASILEAASANPALDVEFRDVARATAAAFRKQDALSILGNDDPRFLESMADSNAKATKMNALCAS